MAVPVTKLILRSLSTTAEAQTPATWTTSATALTHAQLDYNFVNLDQAIGLRALAASPTITGTATFTGNVNVSGTITGTLSGSGSGITGLNAANIGTGTVPVSRGGTNGSATPTLGGVAYGTGSQYAFTGVGTEGQVLTSTGANAPIWVTLPSGVTVATNTGATPISLLFSEQTSGNLTTTYVNTSLQFTPSTGTLSATKLLGEGVVAGTASVSFVTYNGTTKSTGVFYGGTSNPTNTTRLNYDGNLHATTFLGNFSGDGTSIDNVTINLTEDTSSTALYPAMSSTNVAGKIGTVRMTSAKLYFNASTGTLNSTIFNSLSDENSKENITTASSDVGLRLRGVEFTWKETGNYSAGVIAQEVEAIAPHLVTTGNDGTKSVNYNGIIGYLIETIKKLHTRIEALEDRG